MGPLIPGLEEEIVAAAERYQRRRRRRLQAATAGCLAVVFAGALAVTSTVDAPPAAADLSITVRDGRIEVRLTDVETRAQVVEDALRAADIDADVIALPVSPSLVGRFVTMTGTGDAPLAAVESDGATAIGFSVSVGFADHLELSLGRPARPGEAYVRGGNPQSAGEPLACLDLVGTPVRDLLAVATDHPDITIRVRTVVDGVIRFAPVDEAVVGPAADWLVADGRTDAPDSVVLDATPDGQRIDPGNPLAILGCD